MLIYLTQVISLLEFGYVKAYISKNIERVSTEIFERSSFGNISGRVDGPMVTAVLIAGVLRRGGLRLATFMNAESADNKAIPPLEQLCIEHIYRYKNGFGQLIW